MKTLYLDCAMGAAGDMLAAALLDLLPDAEAQAFIKKMNALAIPHVEFLRERKESGGVTGTGFSVLINGEEEGEENHPAHHEHCEHGHHEHGHCHGGHEHCEHGHSHEHNHHHEHAHSHNGMQDIEAIINALSLPDEAKGDILGVYNIIAEAESAVHGVPVSQIHFHEVGAMDAVADIAAVSLLMREIAADRVVCSPVCTGSGTVKCAHGILPVPAPATALILKGIPVYAGSIKGEMCTPTGAALLKRFAAEFGEMPLMSISAVGYGMGKRDFGERVNCVRAILGESPNATAKDEDSVIELSCNIDDMTAEALAFAVERIFAAGAIDAFTVPAGMKKSRSGVLLCVLCRKEDKEKVIKTIFLHTTTIGLRECEKRRHVLERREETLLTPFGEARRKVSTGFGVVRAKWEADDIARIARERGISFDEARSLIEKEARSANGADGAKNEGKNG